MRVFMNMFSTQMNALLCATVVAFAPVCATEQQNVKNTKKSVVWYKKRSNQVAAGLVVTAAAVGLYAFAVCNDKVASPVALFSAFTALFAKSDVVKSGTDDTQDKDNVKIDKQEQKAPAVEVKTSEQNSPAQGGDSVTADTQTPIVDGKKQEEQPVELPEPAVVVAPINKVENSVVAPEPTVAKPLAAVSAFLGKHLKFEEPSIATLPF